MSEGRKSQPIIDYRAKSSKYKSAYRKFKKKIFRKSHRDVVTLKNNKMRALNSLREFSCHVNIQILLTDLKTGHVVLVGEYKLHIFHFPYYYIFSFFLWRWWIVIPLMVRAERSIAKMKKQASRNREKENHPRSLYLLLTNSRCFNCPNFVILTEKLNYLKIII